ncbi:hypothetical protein AKJ41_03460 [candidate division MSBL1 archaeon SCGC-AAA259O05]|uniref:Uncharacterized protein n=1 Tax=candidate division MSBL1 archaeon SCGC-AAA259O05 TaxID=1698271 RepID=A0A133V3A3_9EURY|nr:hypothetical protein AKJ41_03460 [candidate division MSBL1 archaeon SCGC-AAA259O05]
MIAEETVGEFDVSERVAHGILVLLAYIGGTIEYSRREVGIREITEERELWEVGLELMAHPYDPLLALSNAGLDEPVGKETCDVKGCSNEFPQKAKGRGRMTKKKDKGELVAWICPSCLEKLDRQMEWRSG